MDSSLSTSGPIDLTMPWRAMPRLTSMPAAQAPIEKALSVTSGASPNAYGRRTRCCGGRPRVRGGRDPVVRRAGRTARLVDRRARVRDAAPDAAFHQPVQVDVVLLLGLRQPPEDAEREEVIGVDRVLLKEVAICRHTLGRPPRGPFGPQLAEAGQDLRRCASNSWVSQPYRSPTVLKIASRGKSQAPRPRPMSHAPACRMTSRRPVGRDS